MKRGSIGLQVKKGGIPSRRGSNFRPNVKKPTTWGKKGGSRPPGPPGSAHELEGGKDKHTMYVVCGILCGQTPSIMYTLIGQCGQAVISMTQHHYVTTLSAPHSWHTIFTVLPFRSLTQCKLHHATSYCYTAAHTCYMPHHIMLNILLRAA